MKYGKIRIENGNFLFTRHMVLNSLPCKDILWAYSKQEAAMQAAGRHLLTTYLVIVTRRKKVYQFDMTHKEAVDCIHLLKALTPEMTVGFPNGERIAMQSSLNTRDLGAILTMDHHYLIPRKLLRSGDLYHLSAADQRMLKEEYNLKKVIDLRSREEYEERPDTVIAGVEYYHIPILDEEVSGDVKIRSLAQVLQRDDTNTPDRIENLYETMISDQYSVNQLARIMDVLLEHTSGAVLWHGGVGKDRTGVVTVLLLSVLGVSRKIIREDYLRSNSCLDSEKRYMQLYLESRGTYDASWQEKLDSVYHVDEANLNRLFYSIDRLYGSMQNFLKKGLLLSPKAIEELREKYLLRGL